MRWWGWGDPAHASALQPHALELLRTRVGVAPAPVPPVALSAVRLQESALGERAADRLRALLGAERVLATHEERVLHAAGKGYPDLVRLRRGEPGAAPDAVAYPASAQQLAELLALCAEESIAVVPFGGGTSVVGGVAPLRAGHAAVLTVDTAAMRALSVDPVSNLARVQAGMRVRELESALATQGLTLGHYPQSYEYVTVGGCAASRSAGQASTGYGTFDAMVKGVSAITPRGPLLTLAVPHSAAGPALRELIVGSEGVLGVIDEVALRVRRAPDERLYEGYLFPDFEHGSRALRELAQARALPDVARLSDEEETEVTLALAGPAAARAASLYAALRRRRGGCLAIVGFEGSDGAARARRRRARAVLRRCGGAALGSAVGRAWEHGRFAAPYLRDELLTLGVMVETFETATAWADVAALHEGVGDAVRGALGALGTPPMVMCHLSHVYETGSSLYFTAIARQVEGGEIEQWQALKDAAGAAITAAGATITHHHALGVDHLRWVDAEIGASGVAALRALKRELDPAGIMNPGKLAG